MHEGQPPRRHTGTRHGESVCRLFLWWSLGVVGGSIPRVVHEWALGHVAEPRIERGFQVHETCELTFTPFRRSPEGPMVGSIPGSRRGSVLSTRLTGRGHNPSQRFASRACRLSLRDLGPRRHVMSSPFRTSPMRVIHRVHRTTADGRPNSTASVGSCFPHFLQPVVLRPDSSQGDSASARSPADFPGRSFHKRASGFLFMALNSRGRPRHFHPRRFPTIGAGSVVDRHPHGHTASEGAMVRHQVGSFGVAQKGLSYANAFSGHDVALDPRRNPVRQQIHQGNRGGSLGIPLQSSDPGHIARLQTGHSAVDRFHATSTVIARNASRMVPTSMMASTTA